MQIRAPIEILLWAIGILCAGSWTLNQVQVARAQSTAVFELENQWRVARAADADQALWSQQRAAKYQATLAKADDMVPLGLLSIPDVDIRVVVFEGTSESVLNVGAGRVEGTARMGEVGNIAIAAHRDGFFRGLMNIESGDDISIRHATGTDVYTVSQTSVVKPDEVSVLARTSTPALTLITCYPFYFVGDAPERFIVRAELKSGQEF